MEESVYLKTVHEPSFDTQSLGSHSSNDGFMVR